MRPPWYFRLERRMEVLTWQVTFEDVSPGMTERSTPPGDIEYQW